MVTHQNAKKIRFALVGAINTAIDFGLLFILHAFGLTSIVANFISTSVAFGFSFSANRHYTFKASSGNAGRQLVLFLVVTLFALWVIQPIIIVAVEQPLRAAGATDWFSLLVAKLIATIASLVWNYLLYSRVVFRSKTD